MPREHFFTKRVGSLILAGWLIGILISINVFPENEKLGQFLALVWLIPVLLLFYRDCFLFGLVLRSKPLVLVCIFFFIIAILIGMAFSSYPHISLLYLCGTVVTFMIVAGFWEMGETDIKKGLELYAIITGFLLLLFLNFYYTPGSRLGELRNPSTVGLICMGIAITSLTIRNIVLRIVVLVVSILTILATGSRTGFLATSVAFLCYGLFLAPKWTTIRIASLSVMAALVLLILDKLFLVSYPWLVDFFALYDPWRGIGSGFTGRIVVWHETLDLWKEHPIFGIGYRTHEMYVFSKSSAHNGYLALLAEVGIIGTIPIIVLILHSLCVLLDNGRRGHRLSRLGFALMLGILFEAAFERYLINMGNPTSIMFLLFLLMPKRRKVNNTLLQGPPRKVSG